MPEILIEILLLLSLFLLNGLFAMIEIALISSRKARLQVQVQEGSAGAKAALRLLADPNRLLSTVQVGISLVGVLSGAVGGVTLARHLAGVISSITWLAPYSEVIAILIVVSMITYFSLVVGELIPKRMALTSPEKIAIRTAGLMEWIQRIARPFVSLLSVSTDVGMRLLRVSPATFPQAAEEEIKVLIEQGTQSGEFAEAEQEMVKSVFRLGDRTMEMVMTPRTEIAYLEVGESADQILRKINQTRFSYYPVVRDNLDNVVGILAARDYVAGLVDRREVNVLDLLIAPTYIPENSPALNALELFKQGKMHMALVIDEFGGVRGLVTLFDIVQSIVGEILIDDGKPAEPQVIRRPDGSLLLDGMMKIDELKEILEMDEFPEEERAGYQTLGGLMMSQLGVVPSTGNCFEWKGLRFEVIDMDGHRVDKVLVTPLPIV